MKQRLLISTLLALLALAAGCRDGQGRADAKPAAPEGNADNANMAAVRKEIVAPNVLAAQLAPHHEFEDKTTFSPTEPIPASLFLTGSRHIEPRRISAFLVREETIVEEQNISIGADDQRQEFDFRFAKAPRPAGAYQIKFVEIARSNGKPVLLARLFLRVE